MFSLPGDPALQLVDLLDGSPTFHIFPFPFLKKSHYPFDLFSVRYLQFYLLTHIDF